VTPQYSKEKMLYSRNDAAHALSISLRKLEQLIRDRQLRVVRIGRRVLIASDDLRQLAG
jgi:excisionase family DNA binding protein